MDDFKVIYRILTTLRKAMDYEEFDANLISPEALGVSRPRRDALLAMLSESGYVSGVMVTDFDNVKTVVPVRPRITLEGLEYLSENSALQRAARVMKGIKDATPFV